MVNTTQNDETPSPSPRVKVDELLAKCHDLLSELEDFQKFLVEQKKEHVVEIRQFRNSVASELKSLERVCFPPPVSDQPDTNRPTARIRRPNRRTHNSHSSLLQPPLLQCRLDRRKSKQRPRSIQQALLLGTACERQERPQRDDENEETFRARGYSR